MASVEQLLVAAAVVLLGALVAHHRALRRALEPRPRPPHPDRYPTVTVIRPIKGLDDGAAENLRAALDLDYPAWVETLFVFDDAREPAVPLARAAIAERGDADRRRQARIVFAGEPPADRTGKLNAMIAGFREARGELIAFADSDTRAAPDALRSLVATLVTAPRAGSAFAPVVATRPAATLGDAGYAMLLNGLYGPAAAATARRNGGELPFVMGQFSIFTRDALAAIGGLESAEGQLVDDMFLGSRVHAAGYRNVVASFGVPIIQAGMSLRGFWRLYVRWIAFGRGGLPATEFKLRAALLPLLYWLGLAIASVAIVRGAWAAAIVAALVPLGVATSIVGLHGALGGARQRLRNFTAALLLLLIAPAVVVSLTGRSEVEWRGRRYRIDGRARLDTGLARPSPAEDECWEETIEGVPARVGCAEVPAPGRPRRAQWRARRRAAGR